MSQRFIAFVLLVLHVNGSMLLPQVAEQDVYYDGNQVDDINTLVEYFEQNVLDLPDDTPEDEDDDRGQDLRTIRFGDDLCEHKIRVIQVAVPEKESQNNFIDKKADDILVVSFDILTPPPKA